MTENNSCCSKELSFSVTYSDDINSEDYVGQFLDFTIYHDSHHHSQDVNKSSYFNKKDQIFTSTTVKNELQFDLEKQDQKSKSSFHNFQKHLVTTLRHNINLSEVKFSEETRGVQQILWNFFLKCPKMTRTLIYLIYGGLSFQSAKARRFNRQYGLERLLKIYPYNIIKRAQKNLREQTLRQAQKLNFQWQLGNRRMKNKQQFRVYYQAFVEQLKDGGFNKRIPKQKKMKAEKQLNINLSINLNTKTKQDFQGLSFNKA